VVALVVAVVALWYLLRRNRRREVVGFDRDEAVNYIWSGLTREQRTRIAMSHVTAMIEAERAAPDTLEAEDLAGVLTTAATVGGARLAPGDVDDVMRLQFDYAESKGLL
jgi:hypothetical protein